MKGYQRLERASEGGMAVVYRAIAADGGLVALKVLKPALSGPVSTKRFAREAETTRSLDHSGIASVLDAGFTPEGLPFLVYPWVTGPTLSEHGPTSTREAVVLVSALLEALAYAHERGFVHRDITPNNVLIADTGPVLIDFGLVTCLARSTDERTWTRLTRTGVVTGTPPYMAPEQIEGESVSERTDLWAIGALVYWLVSGREPFVARTATLRMLKIVSEPPAALRVHAPHVSPDLEALVLRALTLDPSRRPVSATAFLELLRAVPVSDVLPSTRTDFPSPTR